MRDTLLPKILGQVRRPTGTQFARVVVPSPLRRSHTTERPSPLAAGGKEDRMKVMPPPVQRSTATQHARDESLCRCARRLLELSGYRPLVRLECRVHHGVIELHGTVSSYFHKQMAQAVVLQLRGSTVQNYVRVL
jgi:hypothetical protein